MKKLAVALLGVQLLLIPVAAGSAVDGPAPPWELNDLEGEPHRLEEWRGRWVLLKLGTTKCPNCALELEELGKIEERLKALGVAVVDIYLREDRYTVKKYWKKKGEAAYRPVILYDYRGSLLRQYGVSVIPHLALVDPHGRIAWEGWFTPGPELLNIVESHLVAAPRAGE